MNKLLVTVPRMGSHFLREYLYQTTDINLNLSHSVPYKNTKFLTVARDPKESFISSLTITKHYSPGVDLSNPNKVLEKQTNLYRHIFQTADIIIDYNDLINRTEDLKKYLVMRLKGESNNKEYRNTLADHTPTKYLVTSQTSEHYDEAKAVADTLDFSSFNAIHTKMLSKKIDLDCCPL
jgi:hypothetical protein